MKKSVIFFAIIILIVVLYVNSTLNKFVNEEFDILTTIGSEATSPKLSVNEFVLLSNKTIGVYFKWIQDGKYENAYAVLTPEYKEIVTLEDYKKNMEQIDFSSYQVKDITLKTQNMYIANVETKDGKNHEILIIMKDDSFAIVPEPFLKYVTVGNDITKDKITYELIGYEIDVNKCIFDVLITNNNDERVEISSASMTTSDEIVIGAENGVQIIEPNSTNNISFEVKATLEIPILFSIERNAGKTLKTYNFKLK